jgi:hypothetical protein
MLGAEPATGVGGRTLHRLENRNSVPGRVLHSAGQNLSGQVVLPWAQCHGQLPAGAPVELRRTTRAWAAPPGRPPVLGVEQPIGDQLVQVELRGVPGQVHARAAWSRLTASRCATP